MPFNCPNCTILCENSQKICHICNTVFDHGQLGNIIEANKAQQIIDNNYIKVYQTIPEYFFPKKLIYLEGKINNIPIKFLVDTGAMVSVMSYDVMENLNLKHLLDRKW
tara:strand:+ start:4356 stop:4679 length:324 start_codon:yes stop_codon:yes gene_type:complete